MKEVFNEIFEKNKKIIRGREEEIKNYLSKHYEETFINHELIKIERIDSTDHIKNVGFHEKLSSWRNTYKNIVISSCLLDGGKQKRFDYKFHFTEEKLDAKLVEQIEADIEVASKLKRFAKFDEAYPIIDALIEQIKKKNDKFYNTRLLKIRTEISEAEKTFIKKSEDIKEYERKFTLCKETNNLKEGLALCNKIITISKSIGSVQVLKKYTQEGEKIKKDIEINNILKKITQLEEKVEMNRNAMKLDEAFKNCDEIINLAASIKRTNIQEKNNQTKEEIQQEIEKRNGTLAEISKIESHIQDQRDKKEFDEVLTSCDKIIELSHEIKKKDLENKFTTLKSVILTEKKGIESVLEEIEKLEQKMDAKQDNEEYEGALKVSDHILNLLKSIDRKQLEEKYNNIREEISKKNDVKRKFEAEVSLIKKKKDDVKKTRKERTTLKKQEQQEFLMKISEIENIIEIEQDTLPIVNEYSVQDLLGDLSDDIQETLQKVESLLDDHRVEIKNKISNSVIIASVTGEIVEINDIIEVQENKKENKTVNYSVQSGFENPFDVIIEEAILTDLIPYNFEITNVEMNGEKVDELPDKLLCKDGIEINWTIQNIQPRNKIEINYDLRRRISRTIVFLLGDQLKILKTHFNVTKSEIEGFFDIKIPFTNSYNSKIKGVVIEDIIPLYYISLVKEPHHILPYREQKTDMGELIKWKIETMDPITMNYYYKLIDLFKFEQLKAIVSDLCVNGAQALKDRDISLSIEKYQEITSRLREYIK